MNYFDFFELDHNLDLDAADLERRFHALSRKWHPDLFARRTEAERRAALDSAAVLNDAYRTLRDPIARAEYLLKDNGFDIGEQKSANVPPELLEEVFELNMAIEEARASELEQQRDRFLAMREKIDADLIEKFRRYDQTRAREVLEEIRGMLNRRSYVRNLVNQAQKALEEANVSN